MNSKELNLKLLDLAGFTEEEALDFLPQWEEARGILGLTEEQIRNAVEEYIPANWDIQYKGVRKMIGALIHELVDLTQTKKMKAEGKKVLYAILPTLSAPFYSLKKAAGDDLYVGLPDGILVTVMNNLFNAAGPIITAAEEANFTYGCRHCPLNKARYGGYMKGIFGTPDLIWSFGFICDEGPKTDELIQGMLGEQWKYVISRLPHDTYFGEREDMDDERVSYLGEVFKHDMEEVYNTLGIYPTEEDMKAALDDTNRMLGKLARLTGMVATADPAPMRAFETAIVQLAFGMVLNNGIKYFEEATDILIPEIEQAIAEGRGIMPKGATRIGSYYMPMVHPWVDKMFIDNGCITVMSEMTTPTSRILSAPTYTDPYKAMAQQWLRQSPPVNLGLEIEDQAEKVLASKVDGMYMGFFDFDRWLGAHQKMLAEVIEKKTGIPHFYIEADYWDSRDYGEESLRTRIESICQVVKMRKEQRELAEQAEKKD